MSEKVLSTFTTSKNDLIRLRELTFTEQITTGNKYVIEILDRGTFKKIRNPYFKTKGAADDVMDKIYNLDELLIRRKNAISKLNDNFEDSIEGTQEYEFYHALDGLHINDYDIRVNEHSRAIITVESSDRTFDDFLRKYKFPTNFKCIYILDYRIDYTVMLVGDDKEHCIFATDWLVSEKQGGDQYRLLFERYLPVTFSKFF